MKARESALLKEKPFYKNAFDLFKEYLEAFSDTHTIDMSTFRDNLFPNDTDLFDRHKLILCKELQDFFRRLRVSNCRRY